MLYIIFVPQSKSVSDFITHIVFEMSSSVIAIPITDDAFLDELDKSWVFVDKRFKHIYRQPIYFPIDYFDYLDHIFPYQVEYEGRDPGIIEFEEVLDIFLSNKTIVMASIKASQN